MDNTKAKGLSVHFKWRWEYFLLILLVLEGIIFGGMDPRFLNPVILLTSVNNYIPICIIALFVTFVMVTGGIDIQAGSIIGLSSVCLGVLWQKMGMNVWVAALVAILIGALCGLFSGIIIAFTNIQPMVVTLGGSFLFSGIAVVVPQLANVPSYQGITNFPIAFQNLGGGSILGIPNQFLILIVFAIIAYVLLHRTQYGRKIFLIGVNRNTAEYSGIRTASIVLSTYVFSGIAAGFSGVLMTAYLGTARPDYGGDLTLPIITAVVLGGTSILGGKGTIIGTFLSSLVISFLQFGLQLVGMQAQYLDIPVGILLIVSLIINSMTSGGLVMNRIRNIFHRK